MNLSRSQKNRLRLRFEVLRYYGGESPKCAICGVGYIECLSIDHINGGGSKHKKTGKFTDLTRWLKKHGFPPGYRVLCHNCNQALGHYGYSPFENPERAVQAPPPTPSQDSERRILVAAESLASRGLPPTIKRIAAELGYRSPRFVTSVRSRLNSIGKWPYEIDSKFKPKRFL